MANVLIVEDDIEIRNVWVEALTLAGHTVTTGDDGLQAIKQLSQTSFDVAVFDIGLPRVNGIEVIRLLRRTQPDLPVIAVTGNQDPALAQSATQAGAAELLLKPLQADQMVAIINRHAPRAT